MLILWILLALGAVAAFYFAARDAGDSARMLRVLGILLAVAAIVVFIIWLVGVLDTNTDVDTGMAVGGVALLRRLRARVFDELAALIYDVRALWRELGPGTYKTTPDGRVLRMDYRRPDGTFRTE